MDDGTIRVISEHEDRLNKLDKFTETTEDKLKEMGYIIDALKAGIKEIDSLTLIVQQLKGEIRQLNTQINSLQINTGKY